MGLRGKIPKPLSELTYSAKRKRLKAAKLSPPSDPLTELPAPPEFLNEGGRAVWAEVGGLLVEQGTIVQGDLSGLAALCGLIARRQWLEQYMEQHGRTEFDGKIDRLSVYYFEYRDSLKPFVELLRNYGLTPASRGRVPKAAPLTLHSGGKALKFFGAKT